MVPSHIQASAAGTRPIVSSQGIERIAGPNCALYVPVLGEK